MPDTAAGPRRAPAVAPLAASLVAGGALALAASRARGRTMRGARVSATMDTERQAREISWHMMTRELGWDIETALSLALFRTYAVPSISVLLEATGEFTQRVRKRYDDTELIIAGMMKHGFEPGDGRDALTRMNAMHAQYDIDPGDTLYTLTTFICEPVRWAERFGWRAFTDAEVRAWTLYFRELGLHMGLRDLPTEYRWYDDLNQRYEAEHFRHHPANRAVADASLAMFVDMYLPAPLHDLGGVAVRALLDPPLLAALGYEPAPPAVVRLVERAMRARAFVQRNLMPERRTDYDLMTFDRPSYPGGYSIRALGSFPSAAERDRGNAALAALRADAPG